MKPFRLSELPGYRRAVPKIAPEAPKAATSASSGGGPYHGSLRACERGSEVERSFEESVGEGDEQAHGERHLRPYEAP